MKLFRTSGLLHRAVALWLLLAVMLPLVEHVCAQEALHTTMAGMSCNPAAAAHGSDHPHAPVPDAAPSGEEAGACDGNCAVAQATAFDASTLSRPYDLPPLAALPISVRATVPAPEAAAPPISCRDRRAPPSPVSRSVLHGSFLL